jgi:hypothetical protein
MGATSSGKQCVERIRAAQCLLHQRNVLLKGRRRLPLPPRQALFVLCALAFVLNVQISH